MFIQWLDDPCKTLNEPPVMTNEAEEGSNLSVSPWQCTLGNSFEVHVARPNTLLRYLMGQIVDFSLKRLHFDGFNFRLYSLS